MQARAKGRKGRPSHTAQVTHDADNFNAGMAASFSYGGPAANEGSSGASAGAGNTSPTTAQGTSLPTPSPVAPGKTLSAAPHDAEPRKLLGILVTDTALTRREVFARGLDVFLTPPGAAESLGRRRANIIIAAIEEAGVPIGDFDEIVPAGPQPIVLGERTAEREYRNVYCRPANVSERNLSALLEFGGMNPLLGPISSIGVAVFDHLRSPSDAKAVGVGVVVGAAMIPFGLGKLGRAAGKGARATKAINLPAWKKVGIAMDHIASGHMRGGSRVSPLKDLFPETMGRTQVERAVRQAYRFGKKVGGQGERALIRGRHEGLTIEMWVNRATKTIESAYPVRF